MSPLTHVAAGPSLRDRAAHAAPACFFSRVSLTLVRAVPDKLKKISNSRLTAHALRLPYSITFPSATTAMYLPS